MWVTQALSEVWKLFGLSLDGGDGVLIPVCSKGVRHPWSVPPDASIASQAMFQKCRYLRQGSKT